MSGFEAGGGSPDRGDHDRHPVYVVPQASGLVEEQIDLGRLIADLWADRLLIVAVTAVVVLGALTYALLATQWYRAEAVLVPADRNNADGIAAGVGGLGGLASLAGISLDSGGETAEAIALLHSRSLQGAFIEDHDLLPALFPERWDAASGNWKPLAPIDVPDVRDGVKLFDDTILDVEQNPESNMVTVAVTWTDPAVARDWVTDLVARVNARMRQTALRESAANIEYLKEQLATAELASLRASISALLDRELQKSMVARGREEYAFRTLDPAIVPKFRDYPPRTLIVLMAGVLGGLLGVLVSLLRRAWRRLRV